MGRKKQDENEGEQEEGLALMGEVPAIRMKAPKGATSVSVDGEEYEVDKDGHVVVPSTAEAALRDHGYTDEDVAK